MKVILLNTIRNLGALGETVEVAPGYGRNFLVPQGKATYATAENAKKFEIRRAELEAVAAEAIKAAQAKQQLLAALKPITISVKVGEEGKLFGSIGTRDIADAITAAGIAVDKSQVILPMGVLRQIGEYDIEIEVHSNVMAVVKVNMVAED